MFEADPPVSRRLVIHAGLGKSGSSAIQKYCREQGAALRNDDAGYLGMYLERGETTQHDFTSSDDLARALTDDPNIEDRLVSLITQRMQARPAIRTFIWSHIELAMHADLLSKVAARLAPVCSVEIILYFRHQASWLISAYLQWGVKHKSTPGPIPTFRDWLPEAKSRGADYRQVIESWQKAVGPERLHIRSYDQTPDVVSDFLVTAGLPATDGTAEANWHYRTPDPTIMTLYRLFQGQNEGAALPGTLQRLLATNGVEKKRYRDVDPASTVPSAEKWGEFVTAFGQENAALARDFGLILNPPHRAPEPDPGYAAPATVVPALLDLIISMDRRIAVLERRLNGMSAANGTSIEQEGDVL
ncbi:hypothetical protein [Sphingomonas sp. CCH5-D11]|uniref:hypothetical protein n=1 Tax=Sphingomonas sp. CCH5-D11 TaxID=1768786 RepID=UPI000AE630F0|nr:hypothetical protein [Sphingomonas sp. CCH5-D11]